MRVNNSNVADPACANHISPALSSTIPDIGEKEAEPIINVCKMLAIIAKQTFSASYPQKPAMILINGANEFCLESLELTQNQI